MKQWLTIAAVALVAGGAGFGFYRFGHVSEPVTASSMPAPSAAAEPAAREPITTLPEFSLQNRDGQLQSIRSWPNKSLIVNFWATWCGPCRKEIPLLKEIAHEEAQDGFVLVGIAIDFRDEVLKYAADIGIDYPILIGEQDGMAAADAFGVSSPGLPFTVFTDKQGRIVTLFMGELNRPKFKVILDAVKRVNGGEWTPDTARVEIAKALQTAHPAEGSSAPEAGA